jgi:photosystem II stability/assembly factor-like uncharacterized protein
LLNAPRGRAFIGDDAKNFDLDEKFRHHDYELIAWNKRWRWVMNRFRLPIFVILLCALFCAAACGSSGSSRGGAISVDDGATPDDDDNDVSPDDDDDDNDNDDNADDDDNDVSPDDDDDDNDNDDDDDDDDNDDDSSGVCDFDWCWSHPQPQGNNLYGVWGDSPSDVFAVGGFGAIVRYDGANWSLMRSPTTADLYGVAGRASTDIFAVGAGGAIAHFNGASWSAMASGVTADLRAVWAASGADAYAVSDTGPVLHYDGTAWTMLTAHLDDHLNSVWASSASNVYATAGYYWDGNQIITYGAFYHYDGSSWTQLMSTQKNTYVGVWGSSASDVYMLEGPEQYPPTLHHFDGANWTLVALPENAPAAGGIAGLSASNVLLFTETGGFAHFDGAQWICAPDPSTDRGINAAAPVGPTTSFAVGLGGAINRTDDWQTGFGPSLTGVTQQDIHGVWGPSPTEVYAVAGDAYGIGKILRFDGAHWSLAMVEPNDFFFSGLAGVDDQAVAITNYCSPPGDLTVCECGAYRYDGGAWTAINASPGSSYCSLSGVGAVGSTVAFVGELYQIDYQWGFPLFVPVGSYVEDESGDSWQPMLIANFNAVWGSSLGDMYLVGLGNGAVLHFDGANRRLMWGGTDNSLLAIHGAAADDIFAVGVGGAITHFDGKAWTLMNSGSSADLATVFALASNDVYAAGYPAAVLHYDGASWAPMTAPVSGSNAFTSVWAFSPNEAYLTGAAGAILKLDPTHARR